MRDTCLPMIQNPNAIRMLVGFFVFGIHPAFVNGAPVTVINPGFEDITGETPINEFTFGPLNGWDLYDPNNITAGGEGNIYFIGTIQPSPTNFTAGAPEGQRVALAFNRVGSGNQGEYGMQQTLAESLQANTRYELNIEIGNISGTTLNLDGFPGYRVDLLAGGVVIAQDNNTLAGSIPEGDFASTMVEFETGAVHGQLGQNLQIRLVNLNEIDASFPSANLEVNFDNVRLTASPATAVPEPASLAVLSCLSMAWLLRKRGTRRQVRIT